MASNDDGGLFSGDFFEGTKKPYLAILIQPQKRGCRFRYGSEGKSHGVIYGQKNGQTNKSEFPTVQIMNYNGPAKIYVTLVNEMNNNLNPHILFNKMGKAAKKDADKQGCIVVDNNAPSIHKFDKLAIQHIAKKDLDTALKKRINQQHFMEMCGLMQPEEHLAQHDLNAILSQIDRPDFTQMAEVQVQNIEDRLQDWKMNCSMSSARLCFIAALQDERGQFTHILPPVFSETLHDSKTTSGAELKIARLSKARCSVDGEKEIMLLGDKLSKDDTEIRFFELNDEGETLWEDFGAFSATDVHRQVAITFRTPPYHNKLITKEIEVCLQLRRKKDPTCVSEPIPFVYKPKEYDDHKLGAKRKKLVPSNDNNQVAEFGNLTKPPSFVPQSLNFAPSLVPNINFGPPATENSEAENQFQSFAKLLQQSFSFNQQQQFGSTEEQTQAQTDFSSPEGLMSFLTNMNLNFNMAQSFPTLNPASFSEWFKFDQNNGQNQPGPSKS